MNLNSLAEASIADLTRRKSVSRAYLRSLSPEGKIAKLVELQERYYQMLQTRERKWRPADPADVAKVVQGAL